MYPINELVPLLPTVPGLFGVAAPPAPIVIAFGPGCKNNFVPPGKDDLYPPDPPPPPASAPPPPPPATTK